jgi:PAS domain S-box-containing protein
VILLEHFQKKFAALDLGPHGVVSLRDMQLGTVVRQPEPTAVGTAVGNRTFSKEWPEKLKINPVAGTYFAAGLDDRTRALAYRKVSAYPFYIIVGLFPGDYLAQWQQEAVRTLALVGVFLIVTLLLASLIRSAWKRREADSHRLLELTGLALQQSETQLQLALDSADMGIWAATPASGEFSATAQAKLLHGLPADALLNPQAVLASVHPDDRNKVIELFQRTIESEASLDIELRVMHSNGDFRWVCWRGRWVSNVPGKPGTIIGVVQDITERKRAEQRKDEFLATLAHELRNPLAPIRNALQIMRLSSEPHILEQVRNMFERQVGNLSRLVDDLFDASRISQGKLQLLLQRVELSSVIHNAAETSAPLIHAGRHQFSMTLPSHPLIVNADPTRLAQVFSNLLNNAARYTPEGGSICVSAEQQEDDVIVTVSDNGVGIPPEMLPHVFNMYTQLDRALERSKGGLGIGLTLVKRLVELHGGTVGVVSAGQGQGCQFAVRLPVVVTESAEQRHAPNPAELLTPGI